VAALQPERHSVDAPGHPWVRGAAGDNLQPGAVCRGVTWVARHSPDARSSRLTPAWSAMMRHCCARAPLQSRRSTRAPLTPPPDPATARHLRWIRSVPPGLARHACAAPPLHAERSTGVPLRLGFSLEEVADLLETDRHPHRGQTDAGLRQRAAAKLAEVEAKIANLSTIADTLRATLDAGCTDLIECAGQPQCPLPFAALASAAAAAPATLARSK
jgi:hypothetical protein